MKFYMLVAVGVTCDSKCAACPIVKLEKSSSFGGLGFAFCV